MTVLTTNAADRAVDATLSLLDELFGSFAIHEFETGRSSVFQTLLLKPDKGRSGLPLRRQDWYS
jgi:hypothetical protein